MKMENIEHPPIRLHFQCVYSRKIYLWAENTHQQSILLCYPSLVALAFSVVAVEDQAPPFTAFQNPCFALHCHGNPPAGWWGGWEVWVWPYTLVTGAKLGLAACCGSHQLYSDQQPIGIQLICTWYLCSSKRKLLVCKSQLSCVIECKRAEHQ